MTRGGLDVDRSEFGMTWSPLHVASMTAAKVRGYQGTDFSAPDKMAATVPVHPSR